MRFLPPVLAALAAFPLSAAESAAPGVELGLAITLEGAAGVGGGAQSGRALHGLTIAHAKWEKTPHDTAAARFRAFASVLNHEGRGPTGRFLGDFLAASNIEAFDSTRLYTWWLEAEHSGWSMRAGALLADEEFAGTAGGAYFTNSAFGWPAFISANTINTGPAFFVATPGIRLARELSPGFIWRAGVYDGDSFDSPNGDPRPTRHGLNFRLGGSQGFVSITELAIAPERRPYRIKLGGWYHSATFPDQFSDRNGRPFAITGETPRDHAGNAGYFAVIEHTLAGRPNQPGHVDVFARFGGAASDRNTITGALDAGATWTGPLSGRPRDVAAIGIVHARFGASVSASSRLADPASRGLDAESVIETCYTFALGERFSVKPVFQYIRQPGGDSARDDLALAMVRFTAAF